MQAFDYLKASSIDEVVRILTQKGKGARILCGGTDLLVQLREKRKRAQLLVDIKAIPEVNALTYDPLAGLVLGAAVPCYHLWHTPAVTENYPGLVDAVSLIGGIQIQGRASLGGNLCNASPAADSIPALIVHYAMCEIATPSGRRLVPVEDFCRGPGQTVLQNGEFLVALHLPPPPPRFGAAYLRFTPRNEMDIAVVGVAASLTLDESREQIVSARLALGAVAPRPLLVSAAGELLEGQKVSAQLIHQAARMAEAAAQPIDDLRGTVAQRRHLCAVLTRRALIKALTRTGASYAP